MNVASSLRRIYSSPLGAFLPLPNPRGYLDAANLAHCDDAPPVPNLGPVTECGWRLEGATGFGTHLFAVPLALLPNLPPVQIDVIIPDQMQWSPELWGKLDASRSSHMTDGRFNQLGIAKHVLQVLGHWSSSIPDFEEQYRALPFSSSIVVEEIIADVKNTRVRFSPDIKQHKNLLSSDELRELWKLPVSGMPQSIDLHHMRYLERKAPGIALVQIIGAELEGPSILKARGGDPDAIYHELKQLLHMPPHKNIVAHPLFLVTIRLPGSNVDKVCGFILKYYHGPNFEQAMKVKNREGTLRLADQLSWAKDVARALIHVQSSPVKFASDLKMDNIMMPTVDGQEIAVLIDFEQSRNVFAWAPTEIYLIEWLGIVANSSRVAPSIRQKYTALVQAYSMSRGVNFLTLGRSEKYDNPPTGWYLPWVTSTAAEQEAGNVCLLGKVIWCIFEGVGNINVALRASKPDNENPEFPTFIRSPDVIQDLVRRCTEGSREWTDGPLGLRRNGSKIYPRGRAGLDGEPTANLEETRQAIQKVWAGELVKGEAILEARMRHDQGGATEYDMEKLLYLKRPKLQEVLDELEKFSFSKI